MGDPSNQQRPGGLTVPQVARILPGPAGKLQQLAAAGALHQATPELLGLKDQISPATQIHTALTDLCFQSGTWTAANRLAGGQNGQLHTVKMAKELSLGKVPKMLVILGAVQPSGMNSAFCKVKDPTGSIGAAFHRSVLQHQQYQQGRLAAGSVVLLQQVTVFTPTPGTSYLAVTASNIAKVWPGDCTPDRIRHAQHQPTQQQQQHQQQEDQRQQQQQQQQQASSQQAGQLHSTDQPLGRGSRPPGQAGAMQPRMQTHQQQQTQGNPLQRQQRQRPLQQQDSPSAAGSNRSSLFPPPSPDVSSIFGRTQQPGQQQNHNLQNCQPLQQQQHQRGQVAAGNSRVVSNQPAPGLTQQQQQQQTPTPQGRGLMLPPAPRVQTSSFITQLQEQQQTQITAPQPQGQGGQRLAAQQSSRIVQLQLLDSLTEDLEDLDESVDPSIGTADHLAASNAGGVAGLSDRSVFGSTPRAQTSQQQLQRSQQHTASAVVQQQEPGSQFVPGALLQQIAGSGSTAGCKPPLAPPPAAATAVGGSAAGGAVAAGIEGDDAVDDVVAAIFGSQMAPAAPPAKSSRPAQAAAAASIFGSQLAAPAVAGAARSSTAQYSSSLAGSAPAQPKQQQVLPPRASVMQQVSAGSSGPFGPYSSINNAGSAPSNNGVYVPMGNWSSGGSKGNVMSSEVTEQCQPAQKRFKASPAVSGFVGRPLQPLNSNLSGQQRIQQQQQQPGSCLRQPSAGWQAAHVRGAGASQASFMQPAASGMGLKGVGAACLLDDLVDNELEELDDM